MIPSGRAIDIDTISMSRPPRGFYIVVKWLRLKHGFAGWLRMHIVWYDVVMPSQYITTEHLECPLSWKRYQHDTYLASCWYRVDTCCRIACNRRGHWYWCDIILRRTTVPREFIGGYCSCARSDIDVVPLQYRITIVVIVIGYFASQLLVLVGDSDDSA